MTSKIAALATAALIGSTSLVSAQALVVGTTGGDFAAALEASFFDEFAKLKGIEVIVVPGSTAELTSLLRAQVQSGQVELDITTSNEMTILTDPGIYEKIDCTRLPNVMANGIEGTCTDLYVMRTIGATAVTYNTEAFPNGGPQTWADFFDVEKFPGKRCLMGGSVETYTPFLIALMADGVAPADLYPVDFDRALAKLAELRPHISAYFTNYSMSQQLMRDGECVVSPMLDGRATSLKKEGFPLANSMDNAIRSVGNWSIAKGSENVELAYEFLDFYLTRPEAHLDFYGRTNSATPHKDTASMMDETQKAGYVGSPENAAKILPLNATWIAANTDELARRYGNFLAGN